MKSFLNKKSSISNKTNKVIDLQISELLINAYENAKSVLMPHLDLIDTLAAILMHEEVINNSKFKYYLEINGFL